MITFDDYQAGVVRTAAGHDDKDLRRAILALGLAGETGETVDMIKKWIGHGHDENAPRLLDELGDILWYVAALAAEYDIPLELIAEYNLDKLRERYPAGFSSVASRERAA